MRNAPGELTPRAAHRDTHNSWQHASFEQEEEEEELDEEAPQWWQKGQAAAFVVGKEFPGFVSRKGNERFERLYADSAARRMKLSRKKEEAHSKLDEDIRNSMRPGKRGTKAELSDACNRLYGDADERRHRLARRKAEQEYLEDLNDALRIGSRSRSTPSIASDGSSRWDKLHAYNAEKEQRLEMERQRKVEAEQQFFENCSVHSKAGGGAEAFDRLYRDGIHRNWRQEQRKLQEYENEKNQFGKFAGRRSSAGGSDAGDEATERLYVEGKLRDQRLQAQRKTQAEIEFDKFRLKKSASSGTIKKRVSLLYKDAERRVEDRKSIKHAIDKGELEEMLSNSVHASVRQNVGGAADKIFKRVAHEEDRQKDLGSRSARTPPRSRPGQAQARPATARRSGPGDLDDEQQRTPRRRESAEYGYPPFSRVEPKMLLPDSMGGNQRVFVAPKAGGRGHGSDSGPFIMTRLVEEGARQAF